MRFEDLPADKSASEEAEAARRSLPRRPWRRIHVGAIRYGLAAIKNVGEAGDGMRRSPSASASGAFKSLEDFCAPRRLEEDQQESRRVPREMRRVRLDRRRARAALRGDRRRDGRRGQRAPRPGRRAGLALRRLRAPRRSRRSAPPRSVPPWSTTEKLGFEKELLGFYVTGHPLDEYRARWRTEISCRIAQLPAQEDKSTVTIAGRLLRWRRSSRRRTASRSPS